MSHSPLAGNSNTNSTKQSEIELIAAAADLDPTTVSNNNNSDWNYESNDGWHNGSPESRSTAINSSSSSLIDSKRPRYGMLYVYLAAAAAQLCWSGFHVVASNSFDDGSVNPFVLPFIRATLTTPFMLLICWNSDHSLKSLRLANKGDYIRVLLLSLLGNVANQQLFNGGLALSSAADAGIIQPSIPVVTTIIAVLLKREFVTRYKVFGILAAVGGCLILVLAEQHYSKSTVVISDSVSTSTGGKDPSKRPWGLFLLLCQTVTFSSYLTLQKPLLERISPAVITFYTFAFAVPFQLIIAAPLFHTMNWSNLPAAAWICFFYTAIFGSVAAFTLFAYATQYLPVTISSLAITLQPIFSPLLGVIFLNQSITIIHVIGALSIVAGCSLVVYGRNKEIQLSKLRAAEEILAESTDNTDIAIAPIDSNNNNLTIEPISNQSPLNNSSNHRNSLSLPSPSPKLTAINNEEESQKRLNQLTEANMI